jgi:hypothetical protein
VVALKPPRNLARNLARNPGDTHGR